MIQPGKNTGVIILPKSNTDWEASGVTSISSSIANQNGDWRDFESPGEWQKYMAVDFDTNACVSFSANDLLQTYGNFMIATGQWSQATIDWLRSKGYLDANNKLHFSDRFTAKMSGTTINGNSLGAVWDSIRKNGLVPESAWPFPVNEINANPGNAWNIYYASIPADVIALGKESKKYLAVNYEWLVSNGNGALSTQFAEWLRVAPIQICTAVCNPWNTSDIIQGCGGGAAHATQLSFVGKYGYCILDHYVPFDKELSLNYTLSYAARAVINAIPQPVQPVQPVQIPPTPQTQATIQQELSILAQLKNACLALLRLLGISSAINSTGNLNAMNSQMFLINARDFLKGAVYSVAGAAVNFVFQSMQMASINHTDWNALAQVCISTFVGYIATKYFTDQNGKVFGRIG